MKRILFILSVLASASLQAQVNGLRFFREGAGAGSFSLQQLKDSALQNNIAVRNGRLSVDAARQQRKEAFTKYFPDVSATGFTFMADKGMARMSLNPSELVPSPLASALAASLSAEALAALQNPVSVSMLKNGTIAGVTALQPVFAGGQIINGNRLAKVSEDVSRLQLRLSEYEVEKTVGQYFWQLISLQEKMKTVAAVEAMLADIHKDVDVAVRAGLALRNDLLQVELRQNEVESLRLKLENSIFIVKQMLGQYAGLTSGLSSTGEGSVYSFEVVAPDMNRQDDLLPLPVGEEAGLLPEYQLLQKQVEVANLQRKMEIGKLLPAVAVGAGYNYHNLLDNDRSFGMLFATVSVPVSDWWGGSHAIRRKKIAFRQAQDQLADNAQLLTIRMQNAWNDVAEARRQLDIAQRSIKQSEENLRLHRDYYRAGTCRMSDLLEAQLLYQQSCDKNIEAYADLQNKILEYKQSTGQ